ncbi:nucleotidyltransferase domain-containing protein [Streptomyces sp. NPDC059010]|uniref:nucleotidyltransferase domain-containing protein n=1 Tax=Streptomyces sp. NPDC059010 TaxID=3346695 RepID=UPI0036C6FD63
MTADDVLTVLSLLREARADVRIGGGRGIDALVGEQTRDHGDLDLMHRQEQETAVVTALSAAGFAETLDRRPVRFVVTARDGREIDLHPLVFAEDGSAVQASPEPSRPFKYPSSCFVTGTISGTTVPCLSAEQQVYFHQGYEPRSRDRHDMARLRRAFGVGTYFWGAAARHPRP